MRLQRFLPLSLAAVVSATCVRGSLTSTFDAREATIDGIHNALFAGLATCRDVVSAFISRIEAFNPTINAIITLHPDALTTADELDARITSGNASSTALPLFCIPVLLKDNYDAVGTNTTGGCLDLANNRPTADAPAVKALKDAGALVLGKTNLHELALEGISVSSLGGQTINPYDHTRTPGGSSGGSGASIATSFAVLGTGSDTVNSMRSPASANSLFSFRPTRGLISRAGVIPISFTQDQLGAFARTLKDLAVALTVLAGVGYDARDNATALVPPEVRGTDYSKALYGGSLKGVRLGYLDGFVNHTASNETTPVNNVLDNVVAQLKAAGAEIVNITSPLYNATALAALDVQTSEYREDLEAYLHNTNETGSPRPATFWDLYSSGRFVVLPSQYGYVLTANVSSTSNASYAVLQRGIANLTTSLRATFAASRLDAVIYPEQKNLVVKVGSPSQAGRNGILAALTGSPVVVVPAGFSEPSADAPVGVPVGLEILGLPWTEAKLLNIAAHLGEALGPVRKMPSFANASVEVKSYGAEVPVIKPNTGNIPAAYPIGVL